VSAVLEYLTSMMEVKAVSTLRGYVTAISARHVLIDGQALSLHPSVIQWRRGLLRAKGVPRVLIPPWNLELVLAALKAFPFEPIKLATNKFLTWKTAFLVAIASARRASEIHALRVDSPYMVFSATDVTLIPDVAFLPKVNTPFHASQPLSLPALHDEQDKDLRLLCLRRILQCYVQRTSLYRGEDVKQLFVAYGSQCKGQPISKARISAWLVELIKWVYEHQSLEVPMGIKGHQTRKVATSIADMAGVDPQAICNAATWASRCTFAKHYRLNLAAKAKSTFGRQVLRVAGSASARRSSGYRIPRLSKQTQRH
jgi:hypothetical protein